MVEPRTDDSTSALDALIFDVDGTLADTEELHRQAFNEAFFACGVDWRWGPALYAELLQITGGKERIAQLHQPATDGRGGAGPAVAPDSADPRRENPASTRSWSRSATCVRAPGCGA